MKALSMHRKDPVTYACYEVVNSIRIFQSIDKTSFKKLNTRFDLIWQPKQFAYSRVTKLMVS